MEPTEIKAWLDQRSPATRRFVKFGAWGFLASLVVTSVQFVVWTAAGWGSANFLPGWMFVPIYLFAAAIGVASFYYVLAMTARFKGKVQWVSASLMGLMVTIWVAAALAHSLPQLSTLVMSSSKEIELGIYDSRNSVTARSKRVCRTRIEFGPLYAFRGGWCGVYASTGQAYVFRGEGNALAVRLHTLVR